MKRISPRHIAIGVVIIAASGGAITLALQPLRRSAQSSSCQSNLKQISLAMLQYVRDYDEKYPQANDWMDALQPYARGYGPNRESDAVVEARYRCPTTGSFYVYNRNLAGLSYVLANDSATPWLYETGAGQNQRNFSDSGELWPRESVHPNGGANVLFADAHVELTATKPVFRSFNSAAQPKSAPKVTAQPEAKP